MRAWERHLRLYDWLRRVGGPTWTLIGLLLLYGNGCAWRDNRRVAPIPTRFNWAHMAMLGVSMLFARAGGTSLADLGLHRAGARQSAAAGILLGTVGLVAARLWLALPFVRRHVGLPNFEGLRGVYLVRTLCIQFLLGSAVFEEIAFRGVLHAQLVRTFGTGPARLLGSGVFAFWHGLVVWHNLRRANPHRALLPFAYGGVLAVLFGVGLLLVSIRDRTGNLVGSILAHWLLLAGMILALPRRRTDCDPC
jgi:tRNA pseudouridine32 synthase/23S rRNA pseudouridine746 synthase